MLNTLKWNQIQNVKFCGRQFSIRPDVRFQRLPTSNRKSATRWSLQIRSSMRCVCRYRLRFLSSLLRRRSDDDRLLLVLSVVYVFRFFNIETYYVRTRCSVSLKLMLEQLCLSQVRYQTSSVVHDRSFFKPMPSIFVVVSSETVSIHLCLLVLWCGFRIDIFFAN